MAGATDWTDCEALDGLGDDLVTIEGRKAALAAHRRKDCNDAAGEDILAELVRRHAAST